MKAKNFQLSTSDPIKEVREVVLYHHERWDGQGYPEGLKGEEIPMLARITCVVDAYDVMMHGRPYKVPMDMKESVAELLQCAGGQFDPNLVDVFLDTLPSSPVKQARQLVG
ncbi:MAG: HD-GYP domain-containing protein [bacterium]